MCPSGLFETYADLLIMFAGYSDYIQYQWLRTETVELNAHFIYPYERMYSDTYIVKYGNSDGVQNKEKMHKWGIYGSLQWAKRNVSS